MAAGSSPAWPTSGNLPYIAGSQLRLELALERPVATGSWRETTVADGHYKGAAYTARCSSSSTRSAARWVAGGSASAATSRWL